jgi:very-short-patch-repair endonuclease
MAKRYPYETAGKRLWPKLEPEAQRMRAEPTEAEGVLWQALRGGKLGARFRRQHAIDRFIVDFVALRPKLIVEVDGGIHETQAGRDAERDASLRAAGYRVVRFTNDQVLTKLDRVLQEIRRHLSSSR